MRWLLLVVILGGCDDLDSPMPDLAMPDLTAADQSVALPCVPSGGGFCVWGTVNDFATRQPRAGSTVKLYDSLAFLNDPNSVPLFQSAGPSYSIAVASMSSGATLVVDGPGLTPSVMTFGAAPNDSFHIDPFAIPSSVATGGTLDLFFSDFSPAQIAQPLAAFHPVAGVALTVGGADGGTVPEYVAADRSGIDSAATSTTAAGAALIPGFGGTVAASGGSCTGPCAWATQTIVFTAPGFVWVVPRFQ